MKNKSLSLFKVYKKDLIKSIAKLDTPIVELMLQRQYEQTGKVNLSLFQIHRTLSKDCGGFNWGETPEGRHFWDEVIINNNKELFYTKYPTKRKPINLVKILKKVPLGTRLYFTIGGYARLISVNCYIDMGIRVKCEKTPSNFFLDKYGRFLKSGECVLFPSEFQKDWKVFEKEIKKIKKKSN